MDRKLHPVGGWNLDCQRLRNHDVITTIHSDALEKLERTRNGIPMTSTNTLRRRGVLLLAGTAIAALASAAPAFADSGSDTPAPSTTTGTTVNVHDKKKPPPPPPPPPSVSDIVVTKLFDSASP
jgi:hypothetical protein